jgi:hypothetical protein
MEMGPSADLRHPGRPLACRRPPVGATFTARRTLPRFFACSA